MPGTKGSQAAEILALRGLGWLAADEDAFGRFLAASGVDGADLKAAAGSLETARATLDFFLQNQDLLLRFCEDASISPKAVQSALVRLGGIATDGWQP